MMNDIMHTTDLLESIQHASQRWGTFGWVQQLQAMEAVLTTSREAREQSVTARKQLAETTKQFKRSVKTLEQAAVTLQQGTTPDSVRAMSRATEVLSGECRITIKAYQEEVDHLTKRCKAAETANTTMSSSLMELPDPTAVLNAAIHQLQTQQSQLAQVMHTVETLNTELQREQQLVQSYKKELQEVKSSGSSSGSATSSAAGLPINKQEREELAQLRREVAEYEVEFRSLKNQDITIRKLEARIAELQVAQEEQLKEQLLKVKEELMETEGRRAMDALDREAAMERKVQTLELQLRAERAGREATQVHLLEADEGVFRREAAWDAQRQILVDDAERMRELLQIVTRERDELNVRVAVIEGEGNKSGHTTAASGTGISLDELMLERSAYEAEVAELAETASLLREELRVRDDTIQEERRTNQTKLDALERERSMLASNIAALEARLATAPSQLLVDSMKRELRILKRLEYNADDVELDRDPEFTGGIESEEKDLESVLVAKLRRAESDLVTERVSRTELGKELDALRQSLTGSEKARDELEKLVSSLERDLEKAIATASSTHVHHHAPTMMPLEENPARLQSILDPSSPMPPISPPQPLLASKSTSTTTVAASERAEDDHSVATIVMAQRDRLRARCEALEAERDSFKRELQVQVQASESLKLDNTKLYEKVRYLQNYNKAPGSSRAGAAASGYHRSASSGADRDLDLEALEQRYEASVDPFRQFSKAERQRKLTEMSPMERTVFIVAKTVLATKEMRTALFIYMVSLHLLVFITTYHWSHVDSCHCMDHEQLSHLPPNMRADFGVVSSSSSNTVSATNTMLTSATKGAATTTTKTP